MVSSRNTDSSLPIWSWICHLDFFVGGEPLLPFALKQTVKWFCVHEEKHEHLVFFEPLLFFLFVLMLT